MRKANRKPNADHRKTPALACAFALQINTAYDMFEKMHAVLPDEHRDKGVYKHLIYGCLKYVNFSAYSSR